MATFHHLPNSPLLADSPKFCTIITDQEANNLKIEHEFARRHGHDLPRTVFLKVHPSDKLWEIKVFKSDDHEIFFKNGWKEFKQQYSVRLGDFLVFIFDGNSSKFDVFIYDMTSTQIDCESDEETKSESDDGLGEIYESQKRDETDFSLEKSAGDDIENNENNGLSSDQAGGSRVDMTQTFTKKLKINDLYKLKLPKNFTKGLTACSYIMLKDVKGRERKVNITRISGKYSLGAGWKDFLVNNKVTIGSTLSFEFVSVPYNVLEVVVVEMGTDKNMLFEYVKKRGGKLQIVAPRDHSRENLAAGDHTEDEDNDNVTDQEGGSRRSVNCSFIKQIMFSNRHGIELPKEFIKSTGICSYVEIILKNVKGRGWPVQNTCRTSGRCTLGSGWLDFLADNKVIVGSTLEFKLVSNRQCIIEVRVVNPGANQNELFNCVRRKVREI